MDVNGTVRLTRGQTDPEELRIRGALRDAGCSEECIEKYIGCKRQGKDKKAEDILNIYRTGLLDLIHESQRKIDCLDYLTFQLKKQ